MAYIGKSPSAGVRQRYYFTATGGETSISGTDDNGKTLIFSDGEYIDVYLNGVLLVAGTDYVTTTANTISSLASLAASDIVEVVAYDIFSVADTVSASAGGTFSANVAINGDLTVDTNTLYVDSTNNYVGIGTAAPDSNLEISNAGQANFKITNSTNSTEGRIIADNGHVYFQSQTNHPVSLATNNTTRLTINADGSWGKAPPGSVLQVVQTHLNTTSSQSLLSNTVTNISGLNATITPKSTSSKILVMVRWNGELSVTATEYALFGLKRDSTAIGNPAAAGNRAIGLTTLIPGYWSSDADSTTDHAIYQYMDSPSTTSATTYYATINLTNAAATLYNQRTVADTDAVDYERVTSTMILMEIAG